MSGMCSPRVPQSLRAALQFHSDSSMTPEEQTQFRLLRTLEQHPEYSQREVAEAVGISLGRTNYVLHALIGKGLVKIGRFLESDKKLTKTAYFLTPAGLRLRVDLTQGYIARKKHEYEALKAELEALEREKQAAMPFCDVSD
jgi:EPS-associated MarR family transcriptional regulator